MSADAKMWNDGDWWLGIHDGDCPHEPHPHGAYHLSELVTDIETCLGHKLRWVIRDYPNDQRGLAGFIA